MKHVVKKLSAAIVLASLTSPLVAASYSLSPSNDMFYEAGVLYGQSSDNSMGELNWVETNNPANTFETRTPILNDKFGFTLSVGKHLTADKNMT